MIDKDITSEKELREILAPSLSNKRGLRKECGILEDHDFFDNGYERMMEASKMMEIKNLIDEDFVNYKEPSMFIGMPTCSFKCDKECGQAICQNSALAAAPSIEMDYDEIAERYFNNPFVEAICFGGLEPFDTGIGTYHFLLLHLKKEKAKHNYSKPLPTFVFYTGYYPDEVKSQIEYLKKYFSSVPVIIKFGRFIPNKPHRFDDILGVELASDNQYAMRLEDINDI